MIGIIWLIGVPIAIIITGICVSIQHKRRNRTELIADILFTIGIGVAWPLVLLNILAQWVENKLSPPPKPVAGIKTKSDSIKVKPGTWTLNHNGSQTRMSCDVSLENWFAANALNSRAIAHPVHIHIHHQVSELLNVLPGDERIKNWHPKNGDLVIITDPVG